MVSRAFTKETDGWQLCQEKREQCLFADENGYCLVDTCRIYGGPSNRQPSADESKQPQQ